MPFSRLWTEADQQSIVLKMLGELQKVIFIFSVTLERKGRLKTGLYSLNFQCQERLKNKINNSLIMVGLNTAGMLPVQRESLITEIKDERLSMRSDFEFTSDRNGFSLQVLIVHFMHC